MAIGHRPAASQYWIQRSNRKKSLKRERDRVAREVRNAQKKVDRQTERARGLSGTYSVPHHDSLAMSLIMRQLAGYGSLALAQHSVQRGPQSSEFALPLV